MIGPSDNNSLDKEIKSNESISTGIPAAGYEFIPIESLFNTETIGTVYLKHKEYSHSVDLEIQIIDTGIPLLKGIIDFRLRIKSKEIRENFSHCYEFKNA